MPKHDEYAALISHLALLGYPVYFHLPHSFEEQGLPAIWVQPVGPAARSPGLNHLGIDRIDLDVDILTGVTSWDTGEAMRLSHRIRQHLTGLRTGGFRVLDAGRPVARPDWNPDIRRIGLTVTLAVPA